MSLLIARSSDPLAHILDKPVMDDPYIMLSMVTLVVAAIALIILLWRVGNAVATGPTEMGNRRYLPNGKFAALIEVMVLYLRNDLLVPVMGERLAKRYLSYLLSLFFFILMLNIIGLIPFVEIQEATYAVIGKKFDISAQSTAAVFGGATTASISVTGALALISFIVIQAQAFRELGVGGWLEHLCGGRDLVRGSIFLWLVIPIIFVVELGGIFVKPAALAIRLFANMVAGHMLLLTLTMFGAMAADAGLSSWAVGGITIVSGVGAILITFLEVFVALLQAFIFMFLTAVFISLMAHEEHPEGQGEGAGHGDSHGETRAHATVAAH